MEKHIYDEYLLFTIYKSLFIHWLASVSKLQSITFYILSMPLFVKWCTIDPFIK